VADPLATLQSLANFHRRQLNIPVLAITGSNGKTTTKELITTGLSRKFKVHATPGNLNNHIGVPLTLLGTTSDTQILVCEMGANHPGEIAFLCMIAEPTHGVITNIGYAHLEGFGSIDGVQRAKGELFDYLRDHNGFAFVNTDDPRLRQLGEALPLKLTFGLDSSRHPQISFNYEVSQDNTGFILREPNIDLEIRSQMFGHYNASNVLAAYSICQYFGVEKQKLAEALSAFIPGANRSELISFQGCTIIKDAYNANPSSMQLALQAFAHRYPGGWVILGDMKELGDATSDTHRHIVEWIASMPFDRIFLVGPSFANVLKDSETNDVPIECYDTIEALKEKWDWNSCRGRVLLLKGSRSMHLESLLV
jgi:UDP-N-acetylmuramoyl-tripeptide--D-alanyl-D-alanine ligase